MGRTQSWILGSIRVSYSAGAAIAWSPSGMPSGMGGRVICGTEAGQMLAAARGKTVIALLVSM